MLFVILSSCASVQGEFQTLPPVAPAKSLDASKSFSIDPQIARIFGDPPPYGRLPSKTKWSPDGKHIAYLRQGAQKADPEKDRTELWIHQLESHREIPLFSSIGASVTDYSWCSKSQIVAVSLGDLFLVDISGQKTRLTRTEAIERSPKCSPDHTRVAFAREGDINLISLESKEETQVTPVGNEQNYYGKITWIYHEEFGTHSGFEWSPDSTKLWLYWTDEQNVRKSHLPLYSSGSVRTQSYPLPGDINPTVRIGVAHLDHHTADITWMDVGENQDVYLPYATWHPNSEAILVARLDRLQTQLDLLICATNSGACRSVISERDPRWVNLLGQPVFGTDENSFLWLSEKDGFSHIYKISLNGQMRQLTSGKWIVRSIDAVCPEDNFVYFTANKDGPEEYAVYRLPLNGKSVIEPVTQEPGDHRVVFHSPTQSFIDTHSSLEKAPQTRIQTVGSEESFLLNAADLRAYSAEDVANDIFPIRSQDGEKLMALLTRPVTLETKRKYPVLIYVYGGPHGQVVVNRFRNNSQLWRNFLASRGILVFSVDGRGSAGRGKEFETAIHRNLGAIELQDQISGVEYLRTLPYVDPKRISIFGWSYGGTMVLNALLRTQGVFKSGISVAPVTDWRFYDSAYTERYLQRPTDNPEGYDNSSLLNRASQLQAPLLLVHGLSDDNVHFQNTALMIKEFLAQGKTFDLMVYPDKSHSLEGETVRVDLYTRILRFIEETI